MRDPSRSRMFFVAFLLTLIGLCLDATGSYAQDSQNRVAQENTLTGTTDWIIDSTNAACVAYGDNPNCTAPCSQSQVEGFASRTSVNLGEHISFFVSTCNSNQTYSLKIFRIGWYGGNGAHLMGALKPDGSLQFPQSDGTIPPAQVPLLIGNPQSCPQTPLAGETPPTFIVEC